MPLRHLILWPGVLFVFVLLLVGRILYYPTGNAVPNPAPAPNPATQERKQELLSDPSQLPPLADAPGLDAFTGNCLNCHSARYVLMQPQFPRKVWRAEVTKMVEAYKAPIAPPQQEQIVNYLTAAYGAEHSK
jgi:mono/diheme cytochrome c family protein